MVESTYNNLIEDVIIINIIIIIVESTYSNLMEDMISY